ncbi:acyltransferase [Methylopila sp. M107]|uniref:acyltransferase n=1 Tax=Methylopila sp. M107 TaxID=1101190 RepID=UPI00035D9CC9|nr:acyltransferase [Methylopila sp. M107]
MFGVDRVPFLLRRHCNSFTAADWRGRLAVASVFLHREARRNSVQIGRNFTRGRLRIRIAGDDNRLEIGDDVAWAGEISIRGTGVTVRIGDRCDAKAGRVVAVHADISIGSDCLVAKGVEIRSSDIHRIVDRETGRAINTPGPVCIGDRVWIAANALVSKGVTISAGCVVGAGSIVVRSVEEPDAVAAGVPARIVRRNIKWTR